MEQERIYAFIDESGDSNLDTQKKDVSTFYCVCAVIVDEKNVDVLRTKVDAVRQKHFQSGEMKSSNVSNNKERRMTILNALHQCGITSYAFVADKTKIDKDSGLSHKRSFIKNMHGRLYRKLYKSYTHLTVRADKQGRTKFMDGFRSYLERNAPQTFFTTYDYDIDFCDSKDEVLIQAADIISGSIRRFRSNEADEDVYRKACQCTIGIDSWPERYHISSNYEVNEDSFDYDDLVERTCLKLIDEFIDNSDSSDESVYIQKEVIDFLSLQYEIDPRRYVVSDEILEHINRSNQEPITGDKFRREIIAPLRSSHVIIASSNRGYKIPGTMNDMMEFVAHVDNQAIPYLERLKIAREELQIASLGKYDILENQTRLRKCIEALK